jgi:hypothetical protein
MRAAAGLFLHQLSCDLYTDHMGALCGRSGALRNGHNLVPCDPVTVRANPSSYDVLFG